MFIGLLQLRGVSESVRGPVSVATETGAVSCGWTKRPFSTYSSALKSGSVDIGLVTISKHTFPSIDAKPSKSSPAQIEFYTSSWKKKLQWYVTAAFPRVTQEKASAASFQLARAKVNKHESAQSIAHKHPPLHFDVSTRFWFLCGLFTTHTKLTQYGGPGAKHKLQGGLLVIRQARHRTCANRLTRRSSARMRTEPNIGGNQGFGAPNGRRL